MTYTDICNLLKKDLVLEVWYTPGEGYSCAISRGKAGFLYLGDGRSLAAAVEAAKQNLLNTESEK